MRHRMDHRKLGRTSEHRIAMLRNQAVSLVRHDRLQTTLEKAKELRRFVEKLITLAKKDTLTSRRNAAKDIHDPAALKKLFSDLGPLYAQRPGGYTRIIKLGTRRGDGAQMALIELVDREAKKEDAGKGKGGKKSAAKPSKKKAEAAAEEMEAEATAEEPAEEQAEKASKPKTGKAAKPKTPSKKAEPAEKKTAKAEPKKAAPKKKAEPAKKPAEKKAATKDEAVEKKETAGKSGAGDAGETAGKEPAEEK
ncbi:MAG: 50S ribosomal protein L17 [Acidobacteriota bacterium]|jgi:large subunit ribosomal protein L17